MSLTRRALLKTTPNALVGCIAFAVVFWAATAASEAPVGTLEARLGAAVLEQSASDGAASEDKARQAADLLRRARQAMDENDLPAAEALISKAEALEVRYARFYLGDTPKKARRDLERKRNAAAASPIKPSTLFSPFGLKKTKTPSRDPFAGHEVDSSAGTAAAGRVTPLPMVDAAPIRSPSANGSSSMQPPVDRPYPITQPGENDARAPGAYRVTDDSPLRKARLALAVGDVRRAAEFVRRARATKVNYRPLDDTPEKVEAAMQKHRELSELDKNTEAYARAYARSLMEQADALARWGEYDEAERLADHAAGMRITYSPFEQKPQDLLRRIASSRRPMGRASKKAGFASASDAAPILTGRQKAVALVRQAREAIAAGELDRAESLARRADALRLPDSAFAPGEDRPGLVLLDLGQLRLRGDSRVVPAGGQYVAPATGAGVPDHTATCRRPAGNRHIAPIDVWRRPPANTNQLRHGRRRRRRPPRPLLPEQRRAWRCSSRAKRR